MNLYHRMLRTQRTVDDFKGKPFKDGHVDCIQLVRRHARNMGRKGIAVPKYKDTKGAAAAMKKLGFKTLAQAMDAHFTRIEPSAILVSDIVEMPGQNGFSSLAVAVGNGRAIGFHEDVPHCDIIQPVLISGAWRVESAKKAKHG